MAESEKGNFLQLFLSKSGVRWLLFSLTLHDTHAAKGNRGVVARVPLVYMSTLRVALCFDCILSLDFTRTIVFLLEIRSRYLLLLIGVFVCFDSLHFLAIFV